MGGGCGETPSVLPVGAAAVVALALADWAVACCIESAATVATGAGASGSGDTAAVDDMLSAGIVLLAVPAAGMTSTGIGGAAPLTALLTSVSGAAAAAGVCASGACDAGAG